MSEARSHFDSRAAELYFQFVGRREAGETLDFDAYCRDHPEHAAGLREIGAAQELANRLLPRPELGRSIPDVLRAKFGQEADPAIELEPEVPGEAPAAPGAPSSDLVERLRDQGPRGTRYRVRGEVARGGMGAILEVWDDDLRRSLAMKVSLEESDRRRGGAPGDRARRLGRFLEEAQITGQLDHPGIVPVHELGLGADGRVYFTMRLVKGVDLRRVFDMVATGEDGWNPTRALGVLHKVCEAMSYAHAKGVIHRDLKPANVMVGKFGEVYAMDWGLARVIGREDRHDLRILARPTPELAPVRTERQEQREGTPDSPLVTMDGDVVGTPCFMPPEQAKGELDRLGPWSDVYSLGAMLYQLLTGEMPYVPRGARISNHAILARVIAGPPRPLEELAPRAPPELIAICQRAMRREPAERYGDVRALGDDLRAFLERRVVRAYETGAWAETRKWVQRNRSLAASLAAAASILVAGVVTSSIFGVRASEKARDATREANRADAALVEEAKQRRAAEVAQMEAMAAKADAEKRAEDVLSLSAMQDLEELVARAEEMWPALPERIPAYERWLADARLLVEGRRPDPAIGVARRPGLAEQEAKLAEIRDRALPQTEAEAEANRRAHPRFGELVTKRAELQWRSRMLALEPWPDSTGVEAELAHAPPAIGARDLNELAWQLVDPDQPVYGEELRALALARLAVAAANDEQRPSYRDTLAWALARSGRLDDARAEEQRAIQEVGAARRSEFEGYAATLQAWLDEWRGDAARARRAEELANLRSEIAQIEAAVEERRTWTFADPGDRWWHSQLVQLVADIRGLCDAEKGLMGDGVSPPHGWGIAKRLAFALAITDRSVADAVAARLWSDAIDAIATSPEYGGLRIRPQIGLLPIGADPDSGLWEFAHLQSGDAAQRDADGRLMLTDETGLVLVLIPPGTFSMGSQKADPSGPNYDPLATSEESPVQQVTLDAYFLSKYEMTQGQWSRIAGRNPSFYTSQTYMVAWNAAGEPWDARHPVEQVSNADCVEMLRRLDLSLPMEAQWEHGCRAGTSSPYWMGSDPESLADTGNVADEFARTHGGEIWHLTHEWDDGSTAHARVGSYRPNPFGLHDVHGNVWEWCGGGYAVYTELNANEPGRTAVKDGDCAMRGGGFVSSADKARSAFRLRASAENRNVALGVRPARALRP